MLSLFRDFSSKPAGRNSSAPLAFILVQNHGAMVPVFWTGLALWLLLSLAPLRLMLGLVRHLHSTSTGGLSYQETLSGGRRGGLDDAYMPQASRLDSLLDFDSQKNRAK